MRNVFFRFVPPFHFRVVDGQNIFELSVNRLATNLKVEIWLTLGAFAKDDEAIVTEIWNGLDGRVEQYVERMQNQRTFFNVPLITRASTFKDTNIITLDITTPEATSAEEYAAFVQLLVNLVEVSSTDHPLHDILTFNEKLGETYRIPGIHPFVNFVTQMFPVALSSGALDSDSKSILVSSCLEFLYQSVDSFNADLIKFANVAGVNVDQAIACSSLMAYISLHPGSLIMTHLLDDKILGAILETLNIPIERLNDEPKTSPVVKSILRTLQIINSALNWQQMFIDVVEPRIRDHLQTVTGQDLHSLRHTSLKAIENRILSRVSSVQQIALFINAEEPEIALLAIQTVDRLAAFARGNVPGGVAPIEIPRRNRLLEIIRNSKDSKRILFGVLNKLENVDAEEPIAPFESNSLKQKCAVLALLRKDLLDSPEVPSIAHFLLGYHVTDGGRLELGQGMGNIGSDVSVLKSVFALIDPLEDEALSATVADRNPIETMSRDLSTSEMALEIVVRLCKANLSGAITTMALRQDAVFLQQFSTETMIFPKLLAAIELCLRDGLSAAGRSSIVSSSLRRKTWLLRYLANEMHLFAGQKAHGSLRSMTEYLIGKKSQSRGFQSLFEPESTDARTILSFFEQVVINVGSFDDLDPSRFGDAYAQVDWGSCRSEPRLGYFESDCQQVSELVLLKTQEVVATPPPKDEQFQAKLFEDGRNVVETFVDRNIMQEMTWANGECLEAWSELFTVILEEGLPLVDRASQEGFVNEAVRILALRFSDVSFLQSPHADTLSYILFHLIQAMQDPAAISNRGGILELLDPNTDRSASFFTNIIAAIQGCSHIQSIRENLYFVIYSCITFAISYVAPPDMDAASRSTLRSRAKRFDAKDFLTRLVQLSTANGERFVDMLCHDSLMGDGTVKVTSTLLLSVLSESDAEASLGVMGPILERRGFLRLFVPSITEARNELEEAIRTGDGKHAHSPNSTFPHSASFFAFLSARGMF
jgi:nuclear pore complex protein Nup205